MTGLGGLGAKAGTLALGGLAAGAIAVGVGLGAAVKTAVDMETAIMGLGKATDLSGANLEALKQQLFTLSTTMKGVKLDDLIAMATTGAKAGVSAGDLVEYAEGIAMVSMAMDDVAPAAVADGIAKINSVMHLGVQGTKQMGSAIDKLADSGTSSSGQIMDVVQQLASTAVAAKLSAPELTAIVTTLLDTGVEADRAGTALGALFQKMAVQGKLGANPVEDIIALLQKVKGMDLKGQTEFFEGMDIKGDKMTATLGSLASGADRLSEYVRLANHEFATLDQLNESVAAKAITTDAAWDQMTNRIQIMGAQIGATLLPAINLAMSAIGPLAAEWGNIFSGLITRLTANQPAIEGFFGFFVENAKAVGAAIESLPEVLAIFQGAFTAAFGEGPGQLAQSFGKGFQDAMDQIRVVLRNLPEYVEIAKLRIQEQLENLNEQFRYFKEVVGAVGEYLGDQWEKHVGQAFNATLAGIKEMVNQIMLMTGKITGLFAVIEGAKKLGLMDQMKEQGGRMQRTFQDITKDVKAPEKSTQHKARIAALEQQIKDNERRLAAGKSTATGGWLGDMLGLGGITGKPPPAPGTPGAGGAAPGAPGAGEGGKGEGKVSDLGSFAKDLLTSALKRDDAVQAQKATVELNASVKQMLVQQAEWKSLLERGMRSFGAAG